VGSHGGNATVSLRFRIAVIYALVIFAWFLYVGQALAQKPAEDIVPSAVGKNPSHRAVTVADAIGMTRFLSPGGGEVASKGDAALFSPDGRRFLILMARGNLKRNTNEYSLFLFYSNAALQSLKSHLLVSFSSSSNRPGIQDVKWLDNRSIAFLGEHPNEEQQLYVVNSDTREVTALTKHATSVNSYAFTADRERFFYTAYQKSQPLFDVKNDREAIVVSNQPLSDLLVGEARYRSETVKELFSKRRLDEHEVQLKTKGDLIDESLWLSPNGRYMIVSTSAVEPPVSWRSYKDVFIQLATRGGHVKRARSDMYEYELIDINSGKSEFLIDAPIAIGYSDVVWASDSSSIVIAGTYLPLDVPDLAERKMRESTKFVVEVKVPSREIVPITSNTKKLKLLKWDSTARTLLGRELGAPTGKFLEYREKSADWKEIAIDERDAKKRAQIEVTVDESMDIPPKLFAKNIKTGKKLLLSDPNPQFENFEFGQVEEVSFKVSDGRQVKAGLYRPPNYVPGSRYPLIIQTHGWDRERFWMDGPYSTAYAARPLADKGFVVLQVDDEKDYDKLGTLDEVQEAVAVYEGGIDYLDGLGLIDHARVGIIGFSRSGLFVEYALTQSKYHFAAATLADISDGGYFRYLATFNLASEFTSDSEGINGGAPFGDGLASWVKNSPGFNLDKVTAPIRMEADNPAVLFFEWEWFAGLSRLGKPVDLIYIPDGEHPLVKPWERMASQQGAVDWFCFWLKSEEDPDPAKAEQYVRWRDLHMAHENKNDNKALDDPRQ
jgi:dipeptidyl aminopeptidase/acylaminoacyl peptidase